MFRQCQMCGAELTGQSDFPISWDRLRLRRRRLCPACRAEQRMKSRRRMILFYFLMGLGGIIAVLIDPTFPYGWLLLNLFFTWVFALLCIIPHELGHALAGRMLGMRVFGLVVGYGRPVFTFRFMGWSWTINALPVGGAALVFNTDRRLFRLKRFLMVCSGPLVNVLFLLALFLVVPFEEVRRGRIGNELVAAYDFFIANMAILLGNLWPRRVNTGSGFSMSDGLALLTLPFLSQERVTAWLGYYYWLEAAEARRRHDVDAARRWLEKAAAALPGNSAPANDLGLLLMETGAYDTARRIFQDLYSAETDIQIRRIILNNLAYNNLLSGRADLLAEADISSGEIYSSDPSNPTFVGTRGAVLVRLGRLQEGIPLLRNALERHDGPENKAQVAMFLAVGEQKRGNFPESRRWLGVARSFAPDHWVVKHVEREVQRCD